MPNVPYGPTIKVQSGDTYTRDLPNGAKVSHIVVAGERLHFPVVGVLVARVANDGSTRQQRRAKDARAEKG